MRHRPKDGDNGYSETRFEYDFLDGDYDLLAVVRGIIAVNLFFDGDHWIAEGWEITELDIGYHEDGAFWKSDDSKEIAICLALMQWLWPELHDAIDDWCDDASDDLAKNPPNDNWDL